MTRCPYCNGKMKDRPELLPMSGKRRKIVDHLFMAGTDGVTLDELIAAHFFDGQSKITIRTTIHGINQIITPLKILSRGKRFYIKRDEQVVQPKSKVRSLG